MQNNPTAEIVVKTTEAQDTEEVRAFRLRAREYMAGRLPPRVPGEPANAFEDVELVERDKQSQRTLEEEIFSRRRP